MSVLELVVDTQTGEMARPEFDDFWMLYPRRVAKKDALRAWVRLTTGQQISALVALVDWRRVWQGKDSQYLPHPATWINGERWEDELPTEYTAMTAAHKPVVIPAAEKGEIPQHVRDLLAKMRKK